jgi:Peptidase family M23
LPITPNTGIFMGTDERMHLVYELELTNTSGTPATLQKIEVVDASNTAKALASFEGTELLARLRTTGNSAAENAVIEFNGTRLFLIDLTIEATGRVPDRVMHHMELMGGGSPGPKPGTPVALKYNVAPVRVIQSLVRIGPPLSGKGWVAVNGCCAVNGVHRSTGLPVNGRIYFAQRFAIDWMQLDKDGQMVHGDVTDVHNYTDYGAEILAVASGKVVSTMDGLEDQKPGTLPDPATINLENVDGNHVVLDIGEGLFAFYAHMQKGSVLVKPGDKVTRGQVLGKLGNTGNTSGPHLHFQVMGTASPLGSNGVPYVLDLVTMEGQVSAAQYAAAPGVEGVWNQGMLPKASERHGQFAMDLVIVGFGEK